MELARLRKQDRTSSQSVWNWKNQQEKIVEELEVGERKRKMLWCLGGRRCFSIGRVTQARVKGLFVYDKFQR